MQVLYSRGLTDWMACRCESTVPEDVSRTSGHVVPAPNGLHPSGVWRARAQESFDCGFVATGGNVPGNHELHLVLLLIVIVLVPDLKITGYIGPAQLLMNLEFYITIQENAEL